MNMDYQRLKGRVRLTAFFLAVSFSTNPLATASEHGSNTSATTGTTANTSDDEGNGSRQNLSGESSKKSSPRRKRDWSKLPPSPMVTRLDERLALSAPKDAQENWDTWHLSPTLSSNDAGRPVRITIRTNGIRSLDISSDGNSEEISENSGGVITKGRDAVVERRISLQNEEENAKAIIEENENSQDKGSLGDKKEKENADVTIGEDINNRSDAQYEEPLQSEEEEEKEEDAEISIVESENDQVNDNNPDEGTEDQFSPEEPRSEVGNDPQGLPPVADYPRTPRSKKYDATVSPVKRSTPFKGTLNVPLSINELPTDNFVCCVAETPEVLMTRKEKMINELLPVQLYSFNPENKKLHRSQDELLAILYLWFKKDEVKATLDEVDDQRVLSVNSSDLIDFIIEFPCHQRYTPLPDFLAYIAKKTKRSVLFVEVGNSPLRCSMDIIRHVVFIEYDADLGNVGAIFDKTPRLSDEKLMQAMKVCDRDTFILIKNTAQKRYLFSLPFEGDIPVMDLLQKPDTLVEPIQHIWRQEATRKVKNVALPAAALGLTGLGAYKGWPTVASACSTAYAKMKEVAFIKRCLTFLHLI